MSQRQSDSNHAHSITRASLCWTATQITGKYKNNTKHRELYRQICSPGITQHYHIRAVYCLYHRTLQSHIYSFTSLLTYF